MFISPSQRINPLLHQQVGSRGISQLAGKQLSGDFAACRLMPPGEREVALIGDDLEEGPVNHASAEETERGSCSVLA